MKKLNKKGFTLIELLAVIIIMGVLLLVAVPAVQKTIQQSRIRTYKNNLAKFVEAVSIEVNSYDNDAYQFASNEFLVVPLVCIQLDSGSSVKSPFALYDTMSSYVLVNRDADSNFQYEVAAIDAAGFGTTKSSADNADVKAIKKTDIIAITSSASSYTLNASSLGSNYSSKTAKVVTCTNLK